MNHPFSHTHTNKRYYTYDHFLKEKFGGKCVKIPIDGGFTCPNRDGSKGTGGCSFCSSRGSGDFTAGAEKSVHEQFCMGRDASRTKWPEARYIAYFQAYTNTYAPVSRLRALCEQALACEDVIGISISTRPDCLSEEIVAYLHELADRTFLSVELGLQTVHDRTAERINRCHTYADFLQGYHALDGLFRCVHIINGLPGEDYGMMMQTARTLASLHPDCLKIHLLHVLRGTRLADEYARGDFTVMERADYVKLVCDQLEHLPSDTVIERVTGDGARDQLIAPLWSLKKFVVMNEIDKELVRRNSWQGKYYERQKSGR